MNKVLPAVPNWVYAKLERWHHLSFLRTSAVLNMLNSTRAVAFEPEKIDALLHLIREDLGYELHRAVQRVKRELSEHTVAPFHFSDGVIEIAATVQRADFDEWIAEDLAQIETCVDSLIAAFGSRLPGRRYGVSDGRIVVRTGGAAHLRIALRRGANSYG